MFMRIERPCPIPIPVTDCWVTLGKSQTLGFRLTPLHSAGAEDLTFMETRSYHYSRVFWKLHFCSPLLWCSRAPSLDQTSQNTHVKCLNTDRFSVSLTGHSCATDNQNPNNHGQKLIWNAMYVLEREECKKFWKMQMLIKCLPFSRSHSISKRIGKSSCDIQGRGLAFLPFLCYVLWP